MPTLRKCVGKPGRGCRGIARDAVVGWRMGGGGIRSSVQPLYWPDDRLQTWTAVEGSLARAQGRDSPEPGSAHPDFATLDGRWLAAQVSRSPNVIEACYCFAASCLIKAGSLRSSREKRRHAPGSWLGWHRRDCAGFWRRIAVALPPIATAVGFWAPRAQRRGTRPGVHP